MNKNCISGIDVLKTFKGRINIKENYIVLRIRVIHEINVDPNEDFTNIDPQDLANEINYPEKYEEFSNVKEYDEIEEKYCIVLKQYKDIFSKKPGRISIYEHELKMKDDKPFIIKTYPIPMTSSFWQIPLVEESKKYTAFLHEGRSYEFCVTPFGLRTSTAALVRALDFVLNGLGNFYLTFIDDIFCASEDVHQHLLHLELFFHRLIENNLTINLEKSHFSDPKSNF